MIDNLRRFTPPWSVEEGDDQCFRVYDATGFFICSVMHREDLHARAFQYADSHLKRKPGALRRRFLGCRTCLGVRHISLLGFWLGASLPAPSVEPTPDLRAIGPTLRKVLTKAACPER